MFMEKLVSIVKPMGMMHASRKLLQPLDAVSECVVRVVSSHNCLYAACAHTLVKAFQAAPSSRYKSDSSPCA